MLQHTIMRIMRGVATLHPLVTVPDLSKALPMPENLLNDYFTSDQPATIGLPSVAFCADALNLSPNYFGDLIKKETGRSAQEYLQSKIIDVAKERIFDINRSVSEIAYDLGFNYPQHFTRLLKQKVGVSPDEYRGLN